MNQSDKNKYHELVEKSKELFAVPMRDLTSKLLIDKINQLKINPKVLEIGTGIGATTFLISKTFDCEITSLENNFQRYLEALSNLGALQKVVLINNDVRYFETSQQYDVIIVDGPKKIHNQLINRFYSHLSPNGFLFIDNIYLKQAKDLKLVNLVNLATQTSICYLNELNIKHEVYDFEDGILIIYKTPHVEKLAID